ncbi:uncharacterized protein PV07_06150 [Cladophialophora immunda]|uniref:Uncharacterized protein n=1 Tax=Cladophialophora immunda TaxID=569365 RepID=A0A0D2CJX5_9EURO|nr:uncharacterized protein PV07_06150 [Cladophialophora immunda]KIW30405.1 hypothetical protein PV07_06150 [Cladophialophora immunda]
MKLVQWLQAAKRRHRSESVFSAGNSAEPEGRMQHTFGHERSPQQSRGYLGQETPSAGNTASSRVARAFNVREEVIDSSMWHIFSSIFETALGVWLGSGCCPYPGLPDGSRTIISRLFLGLDEWKCSCRQHDGHSDTRQTVSGSVCVKADSVVNQALNAAVHAFSVRWLPLVAGTSIPAEKLNELARKLWYNARSKILLILQKRCYRSILALYIFGMTPLPPGLEEHEVSHGNIGEVCIDVAMRQLQSVRAKRNVSRFSSAAIATSSTSASATFDTASQSTDEGYALRETIAYWAGFERTVQLLKKTAQDFHDKTEDWRANGFEVINQSAIWIVQSASGCKGVFWKAVASLREALNYGHEPHVIARAQTAVLQCMLRYDVTYAPLLAACKRALLFLDFEAQLNWYLLALHYHLGLLMLYDILDTFDRRDLVTNPDNSQWAAVQETVNIILLGTQCKVSLQAVFGSISTPRRDDMVSLLSVDPYPHHVATALSLVSDFLTKVTRKPYTSSRALAQIRKLATTAFDQLPQCSASLQASRASVTAKLEEAQQFRNCQIADNRRRPASTSRQQHEQLESDVVRESWEEDVEALDSLEIGTLHHTAGNFASNAASERTTSGFLDQWDWTSSEGSPLSFEIPEDDMFLADHGLFERESASGLLSPATFLLVEVVDWLLEVTEEDFCDEDAEVVWKRLIPVLGAAFMESTDLRAKKADAMACGKSWIVQVMSMLKSVGY